MYIHQLSVVFDERQDRLLMRVNTQAGEEVRLWLTRRISLRLQEPLEHTIAKIEAHNPYVAAADARARGMLVELKHEAFLQNADLATPFSPQSTSLPLGDLPLLVTEVRLDVGAQGGAQLVFQDCGDSQAPARSCTLQMQSMLVHGLLHLLQKAIHKSQWTEGLSTEPESPRAPEDLDLAALHKQAYTH
ncbi:MAG: hypothetical protein WCK81_01040 [Betaproteobacteria bacterium]